ncbi:hypothetical protein [Streptomyces sp. NPDC051310]|uniref:hypothetical protein n=1 Tax=Streptomyces sp. NPDC051310 TaxID=3365649 RepID=UPI00379C11C5
MTGTACPQAPARAGARGRRDGTLRTRRAVLARPCAEPVTPAGRGRGVPRGDGTVLSKDPDRITVLFDSVGYRTLSLEVVSAQELLTVLEEPPADA